MECSLSDGYDTYEKYISDKLKAASFHNLLSLHLNGVDQQDVASKNRRCEVLSNALLQIFEIDFFNDRVRNDPYFYLFVEREIVRRLMSMDKNGELFNMAVLTLIESALNTSRCYDGSQTAHTTVASLHMLFEISNMLNPALVTKIFTVLCTRSMNLSAMYRRLGQHHISNICFEYQEFQVAIQIFKKHPQTLASEDQFLFMKKFIKIYLMDSSQDDINFFIATLNCMIGCRYAMTENSRMHLYNALSDRRIEELSSFIRQPVSEGTHAEEEVTSFKTYVQNCRKKLLLPSMTWLNIHTRVRVIGRLSLMLKESAERLTAPGGNEHTNAIKRLRTGPSAYINII